MQNRNTDILRRDIHELLIEDAISSDTSIITEMIFQMAGVEFKGHEDGFNFSSSDKNKLTFSVPTLPRAEVKKLIKFFNVPKSEDIANKPLTLNLDYVFDNIMPKLRTHYQTLKDTNSDIIKQYKVESKGILENVASKSVSKYTQDAIDVILPKKSSKLPTDELNNVLIGLLALKSQVDRLREKPALFENIIGFSKKILDFYQLPAVKENVVLTKKLSALLESIELFKAYHRTEAVLKNLKFKKEMKQFLQPHKISTETCDVIEEALLSLAQVKLGSHGKAKFKIGNGYGYGDDSRLVFEFTDITKEDTKKIIQYLRDQGDETALEGNGSTRSGRVIPESYNESASLKCMSLGEKSYRSSPKVVYESHSIETDGKFFYDTMMKKLQTEISTKLENDPNLLNKYQELSTEYFKQKEEKAIKAGKMGLFQLKDQSAQSTQSIKSSNAMDIDRSRMALK